MFYLGSPTSTLRALLMVNIVFSGAIVRPFMIDEMYVRESFVSSLRSPRLFPCDSIWILHSLPQGDNSRFSFVIILLLSDFLL